MDAHEVKALSALDDAIDADLWARKEASRFILNAH